MAYDLKARGNERYKDGDYVGAEEFYTQAIQKNPHEPATFSNRALVRLKLELWTGAEQDARRAVELYGPKNVAGIKTSYYLAQALIRLQRPGEALEAAIPAYERSVELKNPNSKPLSDIIIQAKQMKLAAQETVRLRERNETLRKVEELLEADMDADLKLLDEQFEKGEIGKIGHAEDQRLIREDAQKRIADVREVFANALGGEMKERTVPNGVIDKFYFHVMHDPVITISGHSFERAGVLKHLQTNPTDPITRAPMTVDDLRTNFTLREVCEEFLEKNPWAADW
ncbi:hypothetical protein AJ80_01220 [Polytolypa hystricis UAMH7299]|uniref:U-box domain-containing protein n=1 Tax=Polytolypa hystricis (strain UAMH7299) TaxID=1447883 RepID=A0A2B7Z0B3_POLH7|nr:hypothetical protein AJ80_01220 [Polytolypa hystricis UAMH7299]